MTREHPGTFPATRSSLHYAPPIRYTARRPKIPSQAWRNRVRRALTRPAPISTTFDREPLDLLAGSATGWPRLDAIACGPALD